jgi:tRNA(fMet)-specific endonuclease VapC
VRFLFDTNAVIALSAGNRKLIRRVRHYSPQEFGMPAIVAHELYYGAFRSRLTTENLAQVEALEFEFVPLDREDARQAAAIRAELAASGSPIGAYDVLIAGQAVSRDLTLITRNVAEFSRVSRLRIENWEV